MDDAVAARQQTEQALAALRQSQEDLDRAQAVGQIGSWRLDVRRNVLTWSDENHRIFGVPKGTPLTYETFLGTIHPDDRQYVDTQWQAGLRGEPYDIEHRLVVDGQIKWVREKAYLEFDDAGELLGGFGITEDITDRKRAEEEIRMLSKFPEQNPNPVLRIARDGVILYANAASAPLLTDWNVRRGEPVPADWRDRVAAVLASGKIEETEATYDGRVYACVLTPIGDQGYVNLYATDVTDRKHAEEGCGGPRKIGKKPLTPCRISWRSWTASTGSACQPGHGRAAESDARSSASGCTATKSCTAPASRPIPARTAACRDGREHTTELEEPAAGRALPGLDPPQYDAQAG